MDPLYFDSSYYVSPEDAGVKAYQLLMKAMEESGYGGTRGVAQELAAWRERRAQSLDVPVRSVFPLMSFGHLEFREMQVDVHPHAYLGKVQGCSSWLSAGKSSFSSAAGIVPTFILDSKG